jgi:hypothetical protein
MVSCYEVQTGFLLESGEEFENATMGVPNGGELAVSPELVTISHLDVGELLAIIVVE